MFQKKAVIPSVDRNNAPNQKYRRIVVMGSTGVGKTAIMSRFFNDLFDDRHMPTIEEFHQKMYQVRGDSYKLDIVDTSGNNPFPAMHRLLIQTGRC